MTHVIVDNHYFRVSIHRITLTLKGEFPFSEHFKDFLSLLAKEQIMAIRSKAPGQPLVVRLFCYLLLTSSNKQSLNLFTFITSLQNMLCFLGV